MRRIFWDTMLFIYLLEGHREHKGRAIELLEAAMSRQDKLFTSYLVIGELMAGGTPFTRAEKPAIAMSQIREMGFALLPFGASSVDSFAWLRERRVKSADAINLSCAAAQGMDLFLTGDLRLHKLHVPGIQFIADFKTTII